MTSTVQTLKKQFAQLNRLHDPIFYVEIGEQRPFFTVVGDVSVGRVQLNYIDHSPITPKSGILRDRHMQDSEEELVIDYGTEIDYIPLKDTVSIEDALKVATYFIEHQELPSLPDYLYWDGWNM